MDRVEPPSSSHHDGGPLAADVVDLCSKLIRFDTTNFGGGESRCERAAAEWVAEILTDAGLSPSLFESAPGRASVVVRVAGRDPLAPALLVHGHLDVVPAEAADWTFDPFCGDVVNGAVRGRGALDMKDMDALMLAIVRSFARTGSIPPRDLVLAFVADEEDTGELGAGFLVREHPELFDGVRSAIGESGGHAVHLPDGDRLYAIATGERGTARVRLRARGTAGHGSRPTPDNAVTALSRAVVALAEYRWPVRVPPTVSVLLAGLGERLGVEIDPTDPHGLDRLGEAQRMVGSTLSNTLSPTRLDAGYKANVIPSEATAWLDGRVVPGGEDEFFATVASLLDGAVDHEVVTYAAPVSTNHDSNEFASMAAALRRFDADGLVLPYCMSGGTDAKAFATLGMACYGFVPGRTPPGFPGAGLVHGVDERVPVESLAFGVQVLDAYLRSDPSSARSTATNQARDGS